MSEKALVEFKSPANLPAEATFSDILAHTKTRLETLIRENPNAVMEINGRYEITRPVALAIKSFLRDTVIAMGGSISFKVSDPKVLEETQEVSVKVECKISLPNGQVIEESALGSSSIEEISNKNKKNIRVFHDAVATAETRAVKRLIEHILGEDLINKLILEVKGAFSEKEKLVNFSEKEKLVKEILQEFRKINNKRKQENKKMISMNAILQKAKETGIVSTDAQTLEDLTEEELKALAETLKGGQK